MKFSDEIILPFLIMDLPLISKNDYATRCFWCRFKEVHVDEEMRVFDKFSLSIWLA